jgi:hypothetical protein
LLAVDEQRRSMLGGELGGQDAADRKLSPLDGGGFGEQAKQSQSVHQSCVIGASPGPVFGAPMASTSAPSGPPSKLRIVSL